MNYVENVVNGHEVWLACLAMYGRDQIENHWLYRDNWIKKWRDAKIGLLILDSKLDTIIKSTKLKGIEKFRIIFGRVAQSASGL
jgi:hypothetical protein